MNLRIGRRTVLLLSAASLSATGVAGTATPAGADLPAPSNTSTVTVTRTPRPTPLVLNMRVGRHPAYDRVVFVLSGPAPGYRVGYVRRLVRDGSGDPVHLPGMAFLAVRLTPAVAHCEDNGLNVYSGPRRQTPKLPTLRGVAFTGDFESVVSFGLGLSHKAGFRVMTLSSPRRIVVDVAH